MTNTPHDFILVVYMKECFLDFSISFDGFWLIIKNFILVESHVQS